MKQENSSHGRTKNKKELNESKMSLPLTPTREAEVQWFLPNSQVVSGGLIKVDGPLYIIV